jgi:hypothetical protein
MSKMELHHQSLSEPIKERLRQIGENLGEIASDIQLISPRLYQRKDGAQGLASMEERARLIIGRGKCHAQN